MEPKYYKKEYNIDNCDSEPLRRILRIQDYGSLVCCDKSFNSWIHYSEDLEVYANRGTVKDYLETYIELDELFDIEDGKILVSKTDADIVLTFHNREESWIIEVESHPDVDDKLIEDRYFNYSLLEVTNCQSVDKFHGIITNEVYHLSGYDHIMVYQFDENMAGQVIAELINAEDRTQFLNLKFPASDIPVQARELYFKEKLRIVSNVDKQHLLIQQDEGISVDLEGICLRGVSPIHLQYLSNMGVKASMSIAIIKDNKLWGLIACHHTSPRSMSPRQRQLLIFFAKFISSNLERIYSQEAKQEKFDNQIMHINMHNNIQSSHDFVEAISTSSDKILGYIKAGTLLILANQDVKQFGKHLNQQEINHINKWLEEVNVNSVQEFNSLSEYDTLCDTDIKGILVVRISPHSHDYIIWVRYAELQSVSWGGNPNKTKTFDKNLGRLTPRESFSAWKEEVGHKAVKWSRIDITRGELLRENLRNRLYSFYNQSALVNKELQVAYRQMQHFAYSVSHDLKSPIRHIEEFTVILKNDFEGALDNNGVAIIDRILDAVSNLKEYIDGVVNYYKLNAHKITVEEVNIEQTIQKQWGFVIDGKKDDTLTIMSKLPTIYGDKVQLGQVFNNIFSNSSKYRQPDSPLRINIWHKAGERFSEIYVEDNGIGIPEESRKRVFEEFRRLAPSRSEGTGLGLSIVKNVVDRHSGEVKMVNPINFESGITIIIKLPSHSSFLEMNKNLVSK